ncbi:hypothetical protein O9K51_03068 [Purpureocillium lavendulum]|uniref:2EXR domain-containing protein n=1 Tax=Purpureocillium lavendulum TaxID=1247861 RepID=A0AB34FZ54_9HYPO|nr:hypothetical protein O9K51_03068 [Purpureocillium lavendulum]
MGIFSHSPRLGATRLHDSQKTMDRMCHACTPKLRPTDKSTTTTEFHLFSQLPPELRLKIWNFNLPSSRLVSIRCGSGSPSLREVSAHPSGCTTGCTSGAPIPVNLHVCAESRAEAFKSYSRTFGFARGPGQVIFNPDSDILFFGPREGYMAADSQFHTCMSMCDQAELARIRRVAISDSLFWIDDTYRSMTAASLTVEVIKQLALRMPRLERIFFVPREEDQGSDFAMVEERVSCQVQMAVATVCQQLPHWRPPPCDIVCLRALSTIGG